MSDHKFSNWIHPHISRWCWVTQQAKMQVHAWSSTVQFPSDPSRGSLTRSCHHAWTGRWPLAHLLSSGDTLPRSSIKGEDRSLKSCEQSFSAWFCFASQNGRSQLSHLNCWTLDVNTQIDSPELECDVNTFAAPKPAQMAGLSPSDGVELGWSATYSQPAVNVDLLPLPLHTLIFYLLLTLWASTFAPKGVVVEKVRKLALLSTDKLQIREPKENPIHAPKEKGAGALRVERGQAGPLVSKNSKVVAYQ